MAVTWHRSPGSQVGDVIRGQLAIGVTEGKKLALRFEQGAVAGGGNPAPALEAGPMVLARIWALGGVSSLVIARAEPGCGHLPEHPFRDSVTGAETFAFSQTLGNDRFPPAADPRRSEPRGKLWRRGNTHAVGDTDRTASRR
jgi:hypothetical protein